MVQQLQIKKQEDVSILKDTLYMHHELGMRGSFTDCQTRSLLYMVRLLQLEVTAGYKSGCKQASSRRHKRRSHEKGCRPNLDRGTGSNHSQRHYPLHFVIQSVTGVDLNRSVSGFVDVP